MEWEGGTPRDKLLSKSQFSRLCEEIDGRFKAILKRPVKGDWPL